MNFSNSAIEVVIHDNPIEDCQVYEVTDFGKGTKRKLNDYLINKLVEQEIAKLTIKTAKNVFSYEFKYKKKDFHVDYASDVAKKITNQVFAEDDEVKQEEVKSFISSFRNVLGKIADKMNGVSTLDEPVNEYIDSVQAEPDVSINKEETEDTQSKDVIFDELEDVNLQTNLEPEEKIQTSNSYINDDERFEEKVKPFKETLYSQEVLTFMQNGGNKNER